MNETKPFCMLPWFHQVVHNDGSVKPCCVWQGSIKSYNSSNFFNGNFMNELRDSFKKGIPHKECISCTYAESTNSISIRDTGFETAIELNVDVDGPLRLLSQDVRLSNVCNLKCRMCDQKRSTKWIADSVAMGRKPAGLLESNWTLSDEQVHQINRLRFPGGEPMMHQDIICNELTKLRDVNRLHLLDLHFTTNMTVSITDQLKDLIYQTKHTTIGCSIDGVSKMNDYIRSDSKWPDVVYNTDILYEISKIHKNVTFGLTPVYNIFNAAEFDLLIEWGSKYETWISPTVQSRPAIQDARNLPDDYKLELIEKYNIIKDKYPIFRNRFESVIKHLKNPRPMNYDKWKKDFKQHNDFLDMRRHTKLADVYPKLSSIINE